MARAAIKKWVNAGGLGTAPAAGVSAHMIEVANEGAALGPRKRTAMHAGVAVVGWLRRRLAIHIGEVTNRRGSLAAVWRSRSAAERGRGAFKDMGSVSGWRRRRRVAEAGGT